MFVAFQILEMSTTNAEITIFQSYSHSSYHCFFLFSPRSSHNPFIAFLKRSHFKDVKYMKPRKTSYRNGKWMIKVSVSAKFSSIQYFCLRTPLQGNNENIFNVLKHFKSANFKILQCKQHLKLITLNRYSKTNKSKWILLKQTVGLPFCFWKMVPGVWALEVQQLPSSAADQWK